MLDGEDEEAVLQQIYASCIFGNDDGVNVSSSGLTTIMEHPNHPSCYGSVGMGRLAISNTEHFVRKLIGFDSVREVIMGSVLSKSNDERLVV